MWLFVELECLNLCLTAPWITVLRGGHTVTHKIFAVMPGTGRTYLAVKIFAVGRVTTLRFTVHTF